jgi:hypothetical protein
MFTDINVVFYFVFFLLGADFCLIHFGCKNPGKFQKAAKRQKTATNIKR